MENEKIQGTVPVTPTQKKKVVEIPPTNVNKKITTIFKQTEKGLIGFHPAVYPAKGKVIIPDKYSKLITVDTVERYQGGARDIIIISFCINRANQLDSLVSMSQEGIDRKLNVALTRAKEQIILIGNKNLLSKSSGHKDLIDHFASK